MLEETWDLFVGSVTLEEFLDTEQPNSTISEIVERYVRSVVLAVADGGSTECAEDIEECAEDIEECAEDIEEYLYRHMEEVRDDVLGHLERLGFEDISVSINNIRLQINGKNYRPWTLLDILESLQPCELSDLVRAMWDAQC